MAAGGNQRSKRSRFSASRCMGTASTTTSAPSSAAAASWVMVSESGSGIPGRKRVFSRRRAIASASTGSWTHSTHAPPTSATSAASVVPQLPEPMTVTRVGVPPTLAIGRTSVEAGGRATPRGDPLGIQVAPR